MSDAGEQRFWTPNNGGSSASWSEERTEQLKALHAKGLSASQMAAEMGGGLTRNAVIGKVHRLKLHRAKPEPKPKRIRIPRDTFKQKVATAAILANPEMSNCALAVQLGISETTIRMARYQLKFPPPPLEEGRKYKRRRIEPRKADTPESIAGAIGFFELQLTSCRFPVGKATGVEQLFCGDMHMGRRPYCEAHMQKAYWCGPRLREAA